MVITSFSCCTDTPWRSATNLHGGQSLVLSFISLDHKAVAGLHCSGRGGFVRGAALAGSARGIYFTGLLVKQHAGGKL